MQKSKILLATICLLMGIASAQAAEIDQVQDLYNREPLLDLDLPAATDTATPTAETPATQPETQATETTQKPALNIPTNVTPAANGGAIEKPTTTNTTPTPATSDAINNPFVESTPVVIAQPVLSFLPQANQITSFSYASYLKGSKGKVAELSQTGPVATNLAIAVGMLMLAYLAYKKNKTLKTNA